MGLKPISRPVLFYIPTEAGSLEIFLLKMNFELTKFIILL